MGRIEYSDKYFNVKDTLFCGQIFRFRPYEKGYIVYSEDKACYVYNENGLAIVECNDSDEEYFYNFFDLKRDYEKIVEKAKSIPVEILIKSASIGQGVRILNQTPIETLYSFIISQNNNISRIKNIIEKLCVSFGEMREFMGEIYYSFPSSKSLKNATVEQLKGVGLGYRATYIKRLSEEINCGLDVEAFSELNTNDLRLRLTKIYGVGNKVADCVLLFGFHRSDSFPVDTWIEKVYRENFNGKLTDRNKISRYFLELFKDYSGYFQQYLFYYKRSIENKR